MKYRHPFIAIGLAATLAATAWAQTSPRTVAPGSLQASGPTHLAVGTVKQLDVDRHIVTIAHDSVASLEWPAMTMQFRLGDAVPAAVLGVGQSVAFDFVQAGSDYLITALQPISSAMAGGSNAAPMHDMPGMKNPSMGSMMGMGSMMKMCEDMMHNAPQR